jgi:hypothetical protein
LFAAAIMAEADLGVLFGAALVVVLDETGADEQDVADLDVAASRGGPDVDALRSATGRKVVVGDGVRCGRVVDDALCGSVGAVVEQDTAAAKPVARPMVDATFLIGVGAFNVGRFGAIVECLGGYMGYVAEAIPLSATLSLQRGQ